MKTAGIIAEFNPFHNGHRYLSEQVRTAGASHILAVMSGSFVQRGEPAQLSKWQRAEAALQNGIDLVLELPAPYALGSAERFASGAVALLRAAGCLDVLAFGSESGDIEALKKTAEACQKAEKGGLLQRFLKQGLSYPAAREKAVSELAGETAAGLLSSPNNTLGIEYLKAMESLQAGFALKRSAVRRRARRRTCRAICQRVLASPSDGRGRRHLCLFAARQFRTIFACPCPPTCPSGSSSTVAAQEHDGGRFCQAAGCDRRAGEQTIHSGTGCCQHRCFSDGGQNQTVSSGTAAPDSVVCHAGYADRRLYLPACLSAGPWL